jgi:hypothetical protein
MDKADIIVGFKCLPDNEGTIFIFDERNNGAGIQNISH